MTVQPSEHGSTIPTPSLPRRSNVDPKTVAIHQNRRQPNEEAVRAARVREGIRLDSLRKQRKAMKR
jgi:hypothetical protein